MVTYTELFALLSLIGQTVLICISVASLCVAIMSRFDDRKKK